MANLHRFYTYAYLRKDRTPYYIGKGTGYRIYDKSRKEFKPPKDKSRIIFLKQNLTEEEAFKHEIYMIAVFGRKDLETGILRNLTDGGEGISNFKHSDETKQIISKINKKRIFSDEHRKKLSSALKGKPKSEETKEKMKLARKNISDETRKKLSESNKGENGYWYNREFSLEHRLNISKGLREKRFKKESD
jgi:hypothetical protein